jgi:hypothetical protein
MMDAELIQPPQIFRVSDNQTWVEQGAGATQEIFYRVETVNRNRWAASIVLEAMLFIGEQQ